MTVASLSRWLPEGIAGKVDTVVEQWGREGKVRRLWEGDAALWTGKGEEGWLGWLDIAERQLADRGRLERVAEDVRAGGFEDVVVLGMGGSSLCPEVLSLVFAGSDGMPGLRVLDSTDPRQIVALQEKLDLGRTLFVVSSKSGTTLEPNIFAAYFYSAVSGLLDEEGKEASAAGKRFVAITDPGSPLGELAERDRYRAVFAGVPKIGGRYSALSDFGMVPGAAGGVDVARLLSEAVGMARACGAEAPAAENPGLALGAAIGVCAASGIDKLTIVASEAIRPFGAWLEQLLAESTGKQGRGVVPVDREPLGDPVVYGEDRLFVYLRLAGADGASAGGVTGAGDAPAGGSAGAGGVSESGGRLDEQVRALREAGRAVVQIDLGSTYQLGAEIFRWEFATAVAGSVIGIDPFDQPDVEDAKVAARELTDAYEREGALPQLEPFFEDDWCKLFADQGNASEIGKDAGREGSLEDLLGAHLGRARPGDYIALLAYLPMGVESESVLSEIRVLLRDRLRVATCVGFGPRFQHSTGQAYKGGPNTGVFLQITCEDGLELGVPGRKYTFGVVKEAQARSDFEALAKRGRRALRIHLSGGGKGLERLRGAIEMALG